MTGRRGTVRPLSVAPMMDRTDRHFRRVMRRITRRTLLYTEMVTTGALLFGDPERPLRHRPEERPLALQLGGDDPEALARCARMGEEAGFDEVNLNVGCPSDRVRRGRFGACLMAEPERVADMVAAMRQATGRPVTVKHRIGIDDRDRYEDLLEFVDRVAEAGADRFTVHARKAWLNGLSPKENRTIPPLRHDEVWRLARERPGLSVETNGGIRDLDRAAAELAHVDAVMIGRAAFDAPMIFRAADRRFFGACEPDPSLREVILGLEGVLEEGLVDGTPLRTLLRPVIPLVRGVPGARRWRRLLTEGAGEAGAGPELLRRAMSEIPDDALDVRGSETDGSEANQECAEDFRSRDGRSGPTRSIAPRSTPNRAAALPPRTATSIVPDDPA